MSVPEITPELLRAVADWYDSGPDNLPFIVGQLRDTADRTEREQADEQRIDEYARTSYAAESEAARGHVNGAQVPSWDEASDLQKTVTRAGIRAVLAKLDEECAEPKFDKGGLVPKPVRQWGDLRNVPDDVQTVHDGEGDTAHRDPGTSNGWRWEDGGYVSTTGLTAHRPYTEIVGGDQ